MLIKIKGRNQEELQKTIKSVMNLACVAFRKGNIPTEEDMQEPERTGLYWYENVKEQKFELLPRLNNHKAFIRGRGDNFIVIEFHSRYDRDNEQVNSLSNLILSFFEDDEVELVL